MVTNRTRKTKITEPALEVEETTPVEKPSSEEKEVVVVEQPAPEEKKIVSEAPEPKVKPPALKDAVSSVVESHVAAKLIARAKARGNG